MAGEEVVGGIKGYLTLDADQFHREILRAIAEAEMLDGKKVDVKVTTTGVDKVSRATRDATTGIDSLTASSRRLADATGKVAIVTARYNELQSSATASDSRKLQAKDALAKALRAEQDAIFGTYDANVKMSGSNDEIARSAKRAAGGVAGMGSSFGSRGMMSGPVIIGGIAAGMALIGPVTGAATAAVVGFTGVVGVGILAWQGFKDEIESGTILGEALKDEIDGLSGSLQGLQATAALSASGGVLAGLEHMREWLPSVNDDVALLSTRLGSAFNIGTEAFTSGLDAMMPLLQDGGVYAEKFATALRNGAQSQEFKDFVEYSRQQLPAFIDLVSSLTAGFVEMAVAMAPVGEFMMASLTLTGKSLDATGKALQFVSKNFNPVVAGMNLLSDGAKTAAASTDTAAVATQQFSPTLTTQANALGVTATALYAAQAAQQAHATAAGDATLKMQLENDAAGILKQGLDALNGEALSAAQAQNSFDSSLATMGDHVNKTGKQITFTTTSITNMSAASVALRGQLNNQVANLQRVVEANGGLSDSTGKARAQMVTMRKQIIDNAAAHGVDRKAVTAYVDGLLKIPKKIPPTKLDVDKAAAQAKTSEHLRLLSRIPRSISTTVRTTFTYQGQQYTAGVIGGSFANAARRKDGGIVGYASGGVPSEGGGKVVGPGTGTSDSVMAMIRSSRKPIMLSNEEFVSTADSQRRNRGALEAGNKGATLTAGAGVVSLDSASLSALRGAASSAAATSRRASAQPTFTPQDFYDAIYQANKDSNNGAAARQMALRGNR